MTFFFVVAVALVSDTFCAPHQQAGEGEADEMVHSIPTKAEIQGIIHRQVFHCSFTIFLAGAYKVIFICNCIT